MTKWSNEGKCDICDFVTLVEYVTEEQDQVHPKKCLHYVQQTLIDD